MHIRVSLEDGVPIYRQIVNQVKYLVASGQMVAGDEMPPRALNDIIIPDSDTCDMSQSLGAEL